MITKTNFWDSATRGEKGHDRRACLVLEALADAEPFLRELAKHNSICAGIYEVFSRQSLNCVVVRGGSPASSLENN